MAEQLTCGACGFANEPERVYCHHCGAKLDRSLLPVVESDKEQENADAARKRIRKMTNPGGYTFGNFVKSFFLTLFWALLVATLGLIARPPEDVTEDKNELPTRLIQSDLMEAVESPAPRTVAFSEADVNGAMKQALKRAASSSSDASGLAFQKVYVHLLPGVIHIGAAYDLVGLPLYFGIDYRLTVEQGKFTPTVIGGSLGRMPIHPEGMKQLSFAYQKLWASFKRERDQMEHMQQVTIGKGTIVFVTKGAGR